MWKGVLRAAEQAGVAEVSHCGTPSHLGGGRALPVPQFAESLSLLARHHAVPRGSEEEVTHSLGGVSQA